MGRELLFHGGGKRRSLVCDVGRWNTRRHGSSTKDRRKHNVLHECCVLSKVVVFGFGIGLSGWWLRDGSRGMLLLWDTQV